MRARVACLLVFGAVAMLFAPADALTLSPSVCNGTNQTSCPQNAFPYATATFTDLGGGTVQLVLTADLNPADANQFIDDWWFNVNPLVVQDGAHLTFDLTSNPDNVVVTGVNSQTVDTSDPFTVQIGQNTQTIDGAGQFDVGINFAQASDADRFNGTDTLTFLITCSDCSATLIANAFNTLSVTDHTLNTPYVGAPGTDTSIDGNIFNGPFTSIMQVQPAGALVASLGEGASPVGPRETVPEPATLVLLGVGLSALGAYGARRRR